MSLNATNFNVTALKSLENIGFPFQASLLPSVDPHSFPVPPKGRLPPPLLPWIKNSAATNPTNTWPGTGTCPKHSHSLLQLLLLLIVGFLQFFELHFYVILVSKQLRDKRRGR